MTVANGRLVALKSRRMRSLLLATLMLGTGCSLRRGLDVDVCTAPNTLGPSLAGVADGVLVYHFDTVEERLGTPCAGAPDPAACEAELARLAATKDWSLGSKIWLGLGCFAAGVGAAALVLRPRTR